MGRAAPPRGAVVGTTACRARNAAGETKLGKTGATAPGCSTGAANAGGGRTTTTAGRSSGNKLFVCQAKV